MKQYVENRVLEIASHTLKTKETIRETAHKFGVSKSTVHKDLAQRLPEINPQMAKEIREILDENIELRAVHGGEATKQKYLKKKLN